MKENQPIVIDVMPSQDRCSIVVLLRSDTAIPPLTFAKSLEQFAKDLQGKWSKSPIDIVKPSIVT